MRGQGLLGHTPVLQVKVLSVGEDLGTWGRQSIAGTRLPGGASQDRGQPSRPAFSPNQVPKLGRTGLWVPSGCPRNWSWPRQGWAGAS